MNKIKLGVIDKFLCEYCIIIGKSLNQVIQKQQPSLMQSKNRFKQSSMSKYENEDAWISDLDPILEGGFKVTFFQPNFAIQIRRTNSQGHVQSIKELMNLRLVTLHSQDKLIELKIQLSSQQDLYRLFLCRIDEKKFQKLKKMQHLNYNFNNLQQMLIKQIIFCQKNINQYSAVFHQNKVSNHRLDFLQNIQYKRIELISLDFDQLDEESLKNYVTFRFTKTKMNKQIICKKLKDVMSMVKLKNQNLLNDILKKEKGKQQSKYK